MPTVIDAALKIIKDILDVLLINPRTTTIRASMAREGRIFKTILLLGFWICAGGSSISIFSSLIRVLTRALRINRGYFETGEHSPDTWAVRPDRESWAV